MEYSLFWLIIFLNLIIRKLSKTRPFVALCDFGILYFLWSGEFINVLFVRKNRECECFSWISCILHCILAIFGPLFHIWMKVALPNFLMPCTMWVTVLHHMDCLIHYNRLLGYLYLTVLYYWLCFWFSCFLMYMFLYVWVLPDYILETLCPELFWMYVHEKFGGYGIPV
jgi:hypothetical protein